MFKDDRKEFEKKWDDIEVFIKYGMLTDEKFYESAKKFFLLKDVNGNYYTLDEYRTLVEAAQTDKEGTVVYLYASDKTSQYAYIQGAEEKGYNVLLLDGQLDRHAVGMLESKLEKTRFVRVDSDTPERLIRKDDDKKADLSPLQADMLTTIFRTQMPEVKDTNFIVEYNALSEKDAPAVITQNEMMRRMKDMAELHPGMNFYGQMPDMYSLVVNTCQPAVKRILKDAEESVESVVRPIRDEIESFNSQISDLRKRLEDKDADKVAINKQVSDLEAEVGKSREKEEAVIKEYAAGVANVKQIIDLALLQSGLLKGEALSSFIRRSAALL